MADIRAIRREAPAVAKVSYLIRQQGQIRYGNQDWTTSIQGVSANYPPITNWQIATGRAITQDDESNGALVALIGQTVARQLFGQAENPIGALMQVKGVPFRVAGTLSPKGQSTFGQDQDDLVMIPFTTAERKVLGVASPSQALTPLNWPDLPPAQSLQSAIQNSGLRQSDLCAGCQLHRGPTCNGGIDCDPHAKAPDFAGPDC